MENKHQLLRRLLALLVMLLLCAGLAGQPACRSSAGARAGVS